MRNVVATTVFVFSTCAAVFAPKAFSTSIGDLFAKYPSESSFTGKPHLPLLTSPDARLFQTRIRQGVARGVRFAGHYEVATWGCGSGCLSFAVIEARSGRVTFFPATISQDREMGELLTYKTHSRAIHLIGSLNEVDSADRWYLWNGRTFLLISEKPAVLLDDKDDSIQP